MPYIWNETLIKFVLHVWVEVLDQFDVDAIRAEVFGNKTYFLSLLELFLVGCRDGSYVFPQLLRLRCMLGDSGSPSLLLRFFVEAMMMGVPGILVKWLGVLFRKLFDMLDEAEHNVVEGVVAETTLEVGKDDFKLLSCKKVTSSGMSPWKGF